MNLPIQPYVMAQLETRSDDFTTDIETTYAHPREGHHVTVKKFVCTNEATDVAVEDVATGDPFKIDGDRIFYRRCTWLSDYTGKGRRR